MEFSLSSAGLPRSAGKRLHCAVYSSRHSFLTAVSAREWFVACLNAVWCMFRAQRYHAKSLRVLATKFSAAAQDPESGPGLIALLQRCGCLDSLEKTVKEVGLSHVKPAAKL